MNKFTALLTALLFCLSASATVTINGTMNGLPSSGSGGLTSPVAVADGGTGATTAAAGFNALSPLTTGGDVLYGGASGAGTRLANGTAGYFLMSNGTTLAPSWAVASAPGNAWITGGGLNLVRGDSGNVEVNTTGAPTIIRGANIQMYTTGSGDLTLNPANGEINVIGNGSTIAGMLRFHDNDTAQIVDLQAAGATTASYVIKLPATKGTAGTTMTYDGTNQLTFTELYDLDITITAGGTTGVQTINKAAGRVNIATGESSKAVTNSLVDTSTLVFAAIQTNDATCTIKNIVPGSGTFTITTTANCTGETAVAWHIIK